MFSRLIVSCFIVLLLSFAAEAQQEPSIEWLKAKAEAIQWEAEWHAARISLLKIDFQAIQSQIEKISKVSETPKPDSNIDAGGVD